MKALSRRKTIWIPRVVDLDLLLEQRPFRSSRQPLRLVGVAAAWEITFAKADDKLFRLAVLDHLREESGCPSCRSQITGWRLRNAIVEEMRSPALNV